MDFLKWDYGAFDDREEMEYIEALLEMRMKVALRKEKNRSFSTNQAPRDIAVYVDLWRVKVEVTISELILSVSLSVLGEKVNAHLP